MVSPDEARERVKEHTGREGRVRRPPWQQRGTAKTKKASSANLFPPTNALFLFLKMCSYDFLSVTIPIYLCLEPSSPPTKKKRKPHKGAKYDSDSKACVWQSVTQSASLEVKERNAA